ncbi:MAG: hypothetical protein ACK5JF_02820 [Oscillospiraceae bacterium]
MASIFTDIGLRDKMTNVLRKQIQNTDKLINSMGKLDTATNKMGNSGASGFTKVLRQQSLVEKANTGIYRTWTKAENALKTGLTAVTNAGKAFGQQLKAAQREIANTKASGDRLASALKAVFSVMAVKQFLGYVQGALDAFNVKTKYEVQLSTVMANNGGNMDQFKSITAAADALEKKTTYGADGLVGGAAELSTYLKDAKALEKMLPTLTNYAAGMGGMDVTPEQMVNYATDLGKALDGTYDGLQKKGFILTDAQKQVIELGTDMERVQVITDVINQSWDGLAESFAKTPEGKMIQFQNTMGRIGETIGGNVVGSFLLLIDTVTAFVESEAGQWLVTGLSMGINTVISVLTWLVGVVHSFTASIQQNWGIVQPILSVIAFVLFAYMIAQLWAMLPPLFAQVAGWLAINWPILLIIAAVGLLVAVLFTMGVSFEDVCGFIGGLLGGLYAVIYNVIAGAWNYWASFVEFFANVFNHPVYSIKKLFVSLANTVLDLVKSIAEAIDAVFGSSLAGSVTSLQNQMQDWLGEMPEGYKVVAKMESMSIVDTVETWSAGGKNIGKGIGDALAGFDMGQDTSSLMGGVNGFDGSGGTDIPDVGSVGEVGRINDEVDISKEDLELLRDIAEARFVQNFVTLTPQVSLRVDTVNENADIDRLLDQAEQRLEEEFVAAAEGVYA